MKAPLRRTTTAEMRLALNPEDVIRITEKHNGSQGSLMAILENIQAAYNYLPKNALKIVAARTGHSLVDLYGIATFYDRFSLEPRGRHLASVCMGTACHVRGSPAILDKFKDELGVEPGQTTEDKEFSLTTVNCLGACALGPVAVLDGEYYREVRENDVDKIINKCRCADNIPVTGDDRIFRVDVSCPHCNRSLMTYRHKLDGHPMVHVTVSFGRKHGWLRLSSFYGDYRVESEHEIPTDTILNFFCPRCHAELNSTRLCARCDAPTIPLFVQTGGMIRFCARKGCKEHLLDLSD